jgi:hypothetical protein
MASDATHCDDQEASSSPYYVCRPGLFPGCPPTGNTLFTGRNLASTVDMRSGLRAVGALRSDEPSAEPVALETPVVATGARPSAQLDKRELFSEETQTVLVFEKGAVIRLSAGVADGQLLFLANKKTGKEVVTQVVRKRSFRPTSCYVDLEFTEPCPSFWGIEFAKSAPTVPGQTPVTGEDEAERSTERAVVPDVAEVDRLKREVSDLQSQLKLLTAAGPGSTALSNSTVAAAGDIPGAARAGQQGDNELLTQLLAQEAEHEKLTGPKPMVLHPKKDTRAVVAAASKIATVGALAAVLVSGGVATYRIGLFDSWLKNSASDKPLTGVTTPGKAAPPRSNAQSAASAAISREVKPPENHNPEPAAAHDDSGPRRSSATALLHEAPNGKVRTADDIPRESRNPPEEANGKRLSDDSRATASSPGGTAASQAGSSLAAEPGDYIEPKLLRAIKPVSPPDALRNYLTGNVNLDALVDATGHVKTVSVLSGPQKLQSTAIE